MLSRFQSLNDLRPPGESDEWYPALLSLPPLKRKKNSSSTTTPPLSLSNLFSFFFISFSQSETNTFNEPTRMTPLQSERTLAQFLFSFFVVVVVFSHSVQIRVDISGFCLKYPTKPCVHKSFIFTWYPMVISGSGR